ncbi:MAG TPA: Hpt domain-containing protein [Phycisphaerae bacterium]|nr:Hpt domain-containing protein [Phycisphaerae bacterium]
MDRRLPDEELAAFELEDLLARCMGNIEFAERILARFQERFESDLAELEQGLAAQNTQHLAGVAHRLKGASANVGAPGLQIQATEIEDLARARCVSEIPMRLDRLRGEYARFVRSVSSLDRSAGAPSSGSG